MISGNEIFTSLNEPKRESVYDIVQKNLKLASRETYVHRSIVVGEHSFGMNWTWGVEEVFRGLITDINEEYNEEQLTGILICYPNFFCHLVEGSEDAQIKYISWLFKKYDNQLGSVKFLAPFHHIYKRLMDKWISVKGSPPRLLRKIDVNCDIKETTHHVLVCMRKLFRLCSFIKLYVTSSTSNMTITARTSVGSQVNLSDSLSIHEPSQSRTSMASIMFEKSVGQPYEANKWKVLLPEYGVLAFFLQSPFLRDVRGNAKILEHIPSRDVPEDLTWPILDVTVDHSIIFDPRFDPVIDLPISRK